MSKPMITKLFVGGTIAFVAGVVVCVAAVIGLFASGAFLMRGPDVVGFNGTPGAWALVGVCAIACLAILSGAVAGLVSWIGALLNTVQLENKSWFIALLLLGLWCFGFVAMIAYLIAGPDGTEPQSRRVPAAA
jgi:hypothetical protein